MWRALQLMSEALARRFYTPPALQLAGLGPALVQETPSILEEALWFAVPKKKVTRGKKRLKHRRYRIKPKQNIIVDPRTGEVTLMHKLPLNWKDYIPKVE